MRTPQAGTDLLQRLLSAAELRSRVISSNLANQSTPGYTRNEVQFEDLLRDSLAESRRPTDLLEVLADLQPEVRPDESAPARPDGNNVTLELEMNALRENRLLYEAYSAMLRGRFQLLEAAVTESR